ncbi:MAG: type IV pilus assembly protein PilM [Candidatus Hydrogenedentales bacterium]
MVMPGKWSGLKKRVVLDIGTSAVRLCEMAKVKGSLQVTKYIQREYNSDPGLEEAARNEQRLKALREVLKEGKVRKGKVILGVPGQSVFTRCRTLPPVPEYKVNQIVRYEIQQQIPFGLDQIALDYQLLGQTETGGFDVMMAAIKVDVVDKYLEILKPLKYGVGVVDVQPLAAYNWLKHTGQFGDKGDCVALIDIGATTTDIVIERGNQFRFTRPLNLGGNDITKALAEAFNMDFVSAEKIKRERCFAPTEDPERDGKAGEVVGRVMQRLVGEITRSFSYFRSLPGGGQVNRLFITGGGAALKNMIPYLTRQLGMTVALANPAANCDIGAGAATLREQAVQASTALGMALRSVEKVSLDINLIPPRILEVARRKEQALYWVLSMFALVLIFASLIPAAANQNKLVKERIEDLKRGIRAYDPELVQRIRPRSSVPQSGLKRQLDVRQQHLQRLEGQLGVLDRARRQRRFWLDEIAFLNEARPTNKSIWFSSLESTFFGGQGDQQQQDQDDDDGGRRMRMVGGGAGGGARTTPGFTGIQPRGGIGVRAGMMGGDGQQAESAVDRSPVRIPNGFIVQGLAESDEAIKEFVENLELSARQLPNGSYISAEKVLFSEGSGQRVAMDTLYDASKAAGGESKTAIQPGASYLITFTIEVKFRRTQDRPNPEIQAREGGQA